MNKDIVIRKMIILQGMKMPKCCCECRFLDDSGDYPSCYALNGSSRGYNFPITEKRFPECPLIEVRYVTYESTKDNLYLYQTNPFT